MASLNVLVLVSCFELQQNNSQIGSFSIQTIILPQSLSDRQYLGNTDYQKLRFRHLHLEVSKHLSAQETDLLSFLKTIGPIIVEAFDNYRVWLASEYFQEQYFSTLVGKPESFRVIYNCSVQQCC